MGLVHGAVPGLCNWLCAEENTASDGRHPASDAFGHAGNNNCRGLV